MLALASSATRESGAVGAGCPVGMGGRNSPCPVRYTVIVLSAALFLQGVLGSASRSPGAAPRPQCHGLVRPRFLQQVCVHLMKCAEV